jgi:hypothetical protein
MTTTATQQSPAAPAALPPLTGGVRLMWLYLVSRRVPAASGLLAALGGLLWAALHWRWNIAGGAAAQLVIPVIIESGAAAVIAVSSHGPFGEPERATGRWLPWLRLATALALTVGGFALLSAGATGGHLPGGSLALLRDFAGMTGIGLLSATVVGGSFGWTGPMGYWLITEGALAGGWTTPWIWVGRPAGDLGGALCAFGVFAAGLAAATVLGPRGPGRQPAPE